jgi:WD40 repeat protein
VFLSHTSELKRFPEDRSFVDAAEAAVRRAGDAVVEMADFPARDDKPANYCQAQVRKCDVYVGLVGLRYGSPVQDRPEVSYTELEFEAATGAGLPRLIFLLDEQAALPIPAAQLVDTEPGWQVRQRAFRERLLQGEGIMVAEVASPEQLEVGLLQALLSPESSPLPRPRHEPRDLPVVREIRARTGLLTDRERDLDDLVAFAEGNEGYRLLVGHEWAGKTALLAELVTARLSPDKVDVVSYFASRSQGDADRELFLRAVVGQLAEISPETTVPEKSRGEFWNLWRRAAQRASQEERHLLLVVDGLDEDLRPGSRSIAAILPSEVAGYGEDHAHVLVSNRLGSPLPGDIPDNHPLRSVEPTELKPHAKASNYERLAELELHNLKEIGPSARRFLSVLAAAAGPLGMEDLRELTELTEESVDELVKKMGRSLRTSPDGDTRRYSFVNNSILLEAQADPDLKVSRYRKDIYHWADRWRSRRWQQDENTGAEVPLYLLDAYPKTLDDDPRRAALVSDAGWVSAAIGKTEVDLVLAELRACVAAAADLPGPARMLATIRGQAPFLRSQPDLKPDQILRQLCLQAAELHETDLADDFREPLVAYPGLIPQWTSRRPRRALAAEVNGHAGWVNAVALTPDGNVVAGTDDGRVWIWSPSKTAAEVVTLGHHDGPVRALAVDQQGRVVSGGHDHRIRLWDHPLKAGAKPLELGKHAGPVRALAIDEDGRVISGGDDARVLVWDKRAPGAEPIALGRHAGVVRSVAVGPGGLVVSGGDDRRARLWDLSRPGVEVGKTNRLGGRVMTVAMAPDCSVVIAGTDAILYRWHPPVNDLRPGSAPAAPSGHRPAEFGSHRDVVRAVSIARDEMVVSGGDDGRVLLWRSRDRKTARIAIGHHDGPVRAVAGIPGDQAISGGQDQRVRIWDLREPMPSVTESGFPTGPAHAVFISPDGYVLVGGTDKSVWMWDPADTAAPVKIGYQESPVVAITALPGGQIVSLGSDGRLLAWDRAALNEGPVMLGEHAGVTLCALNTDSVVSGGYDGRICRWDVSQDSRPVVLGTHPGPVAAVAALKNGRIVSGGTAGHVRIWDSGIPGADPAKLTRYDGRLNALAVLGDHVIGGGDGYLWAWDLAGGIARSSSRHNSWLTSLAAFRKGYVVSGGTDGQMIMWQFGGQGIRQISVVGCSARALAAGQTRAGNGCLVAAHADSGVSYWTLSGPG